MAPVFSLLLILASSVTTTKAICSYQRDGYEVSWIVGLDQRVHFKLTATAPENQTNWWAAIGFGEGHNAGMDIVMVIVENNQATLMDRRSVSYAGSVRTETQHTINEGVRLENGRVCASFSRALVASNDSDDNPLGNCMPWVFPYSRGITRGDGRVVQHFNVPERRYVCDIAKKCAATSSEEPTPTPIDDRLLQEIDEEESKFTEPPVQTTSDQCSFRRNDYNLRWWEESGQVVFDLQTKAPQNANNWWAAVGFGNGHIAGLDVLMAIVENGTVRMFDRKSVSYAGSVVDDQQDITVYDTSLRDGILRARFSRPLVTDDPQDNPIDKCETWAFPYSGGINPGNWRVTMHAEIPERRRICDVAINCKRSPADNSIVPIISELQRSNNERPPLPLPLPLNGAISSQYGSSLVYSWHIIASLAIITLQLCLI